MNKTKNTRGSRLQHLLDTYEISPEKLAGLVEMSGQAVRAIIKNESKPYRSTIEKLAAALGTTFEYLEHGKGEDLPNGKKDLSVTSKRADEGWKDEAWQLAKEELREKGDLLRNLGSSFAILTKMLQESGVSFLRPVAKTGTYE